MSEVTEEGFVKIEATYAGRREGIKNTVFVMFYQGERDLVFSSASALKRCKKFIIGGVYQLEQKEDIYRILNKFLRSSGDDRMPGWRAADEALDVAARARKIMADEKAKSKETMAEALTPFRTAYRGTDYIGRLAIEVVLLAALRRTM